MKYKKILIYSLAAALACCSLPQAAAQAQEISIKAEDTQNGNPETSVGVMDPIGAAALAGTEDSIGTTDSTGTTDPTGISDFTRTIDSAGTLNSTDASDSIGTADSADASDSIGTADSANASDSMGTRDSISVSDSKGKVYLTGALDSTEPAVFTEPADSAGIENPIGAPGSAEKTGTEGGDAYTETDSDTELNPDSLKPGQLSEHVMGYDSIYTESRQMANVPQEGIYFLNGSKLVFYSLKTAEAETAYTFSGAEAAYDATGRLYVLERPYDMDINDYKSQISIYSLDEKKFERTVPLTIGGESVDWDAIGVDANGRVYLAGTEEDASYIYLLSPGGGLLSKAKSPGRVYGFGGFDSTNGNFYFEHYYNWYYWGYEHDMNALGVGSVDGDAIQVCPDTAALISQKYFYERQRPMDFIGDKYLCIDRTLYSSMEVWPSASIDPENPGEAAIFSIERDNEDANGEFDSLACVGARTVYQESRGSIITFKDKGTLAEYIPETKKLIGEYKTSHPVFSLMNYGEHIIAIEKEGNEFYVEELECKAPTYIAIQGASDSMAPAAGMQLTVSADGSFQNTVTWSSSDSKVVSVTQSGKAFAWREGAAVITAKTQTGLTAEYKITVTGKAPVQTPKNSAAKLEGSKSENISANTYQTYGRVVNSYLAENPDGTFTRVENISGKVVAETYDGATKKPISSKTLEKELGLFGGFFSGDGYNYIAYGQANPKEKDDVEVLRVVKYSKSWEKLASASVFGANTYAPFEAGSLRMAETGGRLYVYTCHEMYAEGDGVHHQANMTYVIKESDMSTEQSYYDILNISQAGYVSHSFNQFVQTDSQYAYRVDHGDAYPRAVSITRCEVGGSITDVRYALPFPIEGATGNNATGVSVGGFELSSENCLIAGNSVPQGKDFTGASGQRNIFVTVTSKDLQDTHTVWVTNYKGGATVVGTPHFVKIGEDQFLLMWEEYSSKDRKSATKLVTMDSEGSLTSDIVPSGLPLSDCKPALFANGLVNWYTADNAAPQMYSVNPYDLDAVKAASPDKNEGKVKVKGISISGISKKIAAGKKVKLSVKVTPSNAANKSVTWKSSNTKVATVTQSGVVTLKKGSGGKSVKITATAKDGSGKKASYTIASMKGVVKKVTISGKKSVKAQKTLQLKAKVTASKNANKKLKWASSNPKYATVSSSGKVKAYKAGKGKKVKITAQATDGSGKKAGVTLLIK